MKSLVLLLLASNLALADDAGLLQCRAMKDAAARLACYDGLPVAAAAGKPAPATPAKATPEQFGLEEKRAAPVLASIDSHIPGRFDGWSPNASIRLANGQVWQVADGSSGAHWIEDPKVRVRRGALGAFYLEIEGTNRSPRVTRVQ